MILKNITDVPLGDILLLLIREKKVMRLLRSIFKDHGYKIFSKDIVT